ncbi:type I pullulanase [Culicoidibacter larvae]|uniref:Type I pullulanase n=1 Tax=Culicoidibacter larvae TaxID=2579976 RepID=A0A5R8QCH6_9FIRM|nr:type I pullulanase [Culicoidibacter larvae]TLG74225.1 type I pullulanase [Culicoidibacter larvae]
MDKHIFAFWDDFQKIIIEDYQQKINDTNQFMLVGNDEQIELLFVSDYYVGDGHIFEYTIKHELLFGSEYRVVSDNGINVVLENRNIVRTAEFDKRFYYDGDDLGVHYLPTQTEFAVWTPIATELLLWVKNADKTLIKRFTRSEAGVWRLQLKGDFELSEYLLLVKVNGLWQVTTDPYARASTANAERSVVVNPASVQVDAQKNFLPAFDFPTDAIIYETHVRDFSIQDGQVFANKGKFLGMSERGLANDAGDSIGIDYLTELGVTHVQVLPVFDFGRSDELAELPAYNWGYDPIQYNVPEGSYATDATQPYSRIIELKQMIAAFHMQGIRVNMDVVYNHVFEAGQFAYGVLVPGYLFRYDALNHLLDGTGCGNDVASERRMVRKFIVESICYWATEYGFDGFRFDLMGILDIDTMNAIREAINDIDSSMLIYGEGWNMASGIEEKEKAMAENAQSLPQIGFFNADFRDAIKGSTFQHDARGLVANGFERLPIIASLLAGSVYQTGIAVHFEEPSQSINYVSCHDNLILFDRILRSGMSDGMSRVYTYQQLALALVLVSQGIPFLHAGDEFFRTKNGVEDSYNAPDAINMIDWNRRSEFKTTVEYIKGLIAIRKMHGAFRMKSAQEIFEHVKITSNNLNIYYDLFNVGYCGDYNDIKVIINLSDEELAIDLPLEWQCFAENSWASISAKTRKNEIIEVAAHTLAIYMR